MKLLALDERLAAVLPGGSLFAVGGRVRDEIRAGIDGIELPAADSDYVVVGISSTSWSRVSARSAALTLWVPRFR